LAPSLKGGKNPYTDAWRFFFYVRTR